MKLIEIIGFFTPNCMAKIPVSNLIIISIIAMPNWFSAIIKPRYIDNLSEEKLFGPKLTQVHTHILSIKANNCATADECYF